VGIFTGDCTIGADVGEGGVGRTGGVGVASPAMETSAQFTKISEITVP